MLRSIGGLGVVLLATLLTSCEPPGVVRAAKPVLDVEPSLAPYAHETTELEITGDGCSFTTDMTGVPAGSAASRDWSLRGDETFTASELPLSERCWYEQLWRTLLTPERYSHYTEVARSGDLYLYSRTLNTHINSLLVAFRVTGDLALLDEVDRLAQHMRSVLDDAWKGPAAFDRDGIDGYLNWVWRQSNDSLRGRDTHTTDEMRAHSLVAQFAWAFRANEGLTSPNGVDYKERADFWTEYLTNHFEAKWRERNDVPWPRFPFMSRPHTHETLEFVKYNHYLYLLTGEAEYQREAARLSQLSFDNFVLADSEAGDALVVTRSVLASGGHEDYLMPSTYVRYLYSSAVDLYFEGVEPWDSDEVMRKLSRSMSQYIIDNGTEDFARDMGGGEARGGIPASDVDDWSRFGPERFNTSPYVFMGAWDSTGKILDVSRQLYANIRSDKRDVFIPVGELLALALESG